MSDKLKVQVVSTHDKLRFRGGHSFAPGERKTVEVTLEQCEALKGDSKLVVIELDEKPSKKADK